MSQHLYQAHSITYRTVEKHTIDNVLGRKNGCLYLSTLITFIMMHEIHFQATESLTIIHLQTL